MLSEILKAVGGEVLGSAKEGFTDRLEETVANMRAEMRAVFKEYTKKTQKMLVDTALIMAFLVIGLYFFAGGATELIDFYSGISGLGALLLGAILIILGMQLYKKSHKAIEA